MKLVWFDIIILKMTLFSLYLQVLLLLQNKKKSLPTVTSNNNQTRTQSTLKKEKGMLTWTSLIVSANLCVKSINW